MAKKAKSPKKKIKYPYEYDPEKRRKAKAYSRIKIVSGLVNGFLVPVVFLLLIYFSGAGFFLSGFLEMGAFSVPVFIFAVLILLSIVEFPLGFYSSYLYEHKYGLSRHSKKSWFRDYFKSLLIGFIFGVPVLSVVYFFMGFQHWWVWAAVLYFFLDIFLDTIYPVLILPFFYKLFPFKNKRLKSRLLEMAQQAGAKNIRNVVVAKESDKSVKANAMFAGLGKTKKIVLFDTLLDNFTEEEVETVIGHELGHYVHKDIWKDIILSTLLLFPTFFIIHLLLSSAPGLSWFGDIAGFPLFLAGFELIGLILMPLENAFSRRCERQADWFGLEASKKPVAQISTEKRLADLALSDETPHPLVEFILFSHPSAEKRIKMVKDWEKQK